MVVYNATENVHFLRHMLHELIKYSFQNLKAINNYLIMYSGPNAKSLKRACQGWFLNIISETKLNREISRNMYSCSDNTVHINDPDLLYMKCTNT